MASDVDSEVSVSLSSFHLSEINSSDPLEEASCRSVSPTLSEQLEVVMVTPTASEPAVFTQASPKSSQQALSLTAGYKLVFDNLDKTIKPRYMRSDSQTISLHCVQVYGVRDRIDYSSFSTERPTEVTLFDILPSCDDLNLLKEDFTILITRIIHANLPYFGDDFKKLVTKHIPHKYSAIMSKKSEAICGGQCEG